MFRKDFANNNKKQPESSKTSLKCSSVMKKFVATQKFSLFKTKKCGEIKNSFWKIANQYGA